MLPLRGKEVQPVRLLADGRLQDVQGTGLQGTMTRGHHDRALQASLLHYKETRTSGAPLPVAAAVQRSTT